MGEPACSTADVSSNVSEEWTIVSSCTAAPRGGAVSLGYDTKLTAPELRQLSGCSSCQQLCALTPRLAAQTGQNTLGRYAHP